ncbi:MAG: phosphonate metabolism protein/1,5-bisphosphokinase (PRPP-forming) PhnN [Mesorhizobium sp.]
MSLALDPGRPRPRSERIGPGAFVFVVGPSGAGKDTLLAHARAQLSGEPRISFVRRVVTRLADAGTEDHDTLSDAAFEEAEARGAFALTWSAHGLRYGIPQGVDRVVAGGGVAVANGSRGAIPALRSRYVNVVVAEITAAPEILAARLAARGRENRQQIGSRLQRAARLGAAERPTITIANDSRPEGAGELLVAAILSALARPPR